MSLGKGSIYSMSTKQKSVAQSSTKGELIGIHDVLLQMLWMKHFLNTQGYLVEDTMLYQDNKSYILLATNR